MSAALKRLRGTDRTVLDGLLALAALVAIELTALLTSGISPHDRVVTAIAAVPFAGAIAARRLWPAPALICAAAVVTLSMPLGGQLLTNDNAYVVPLLVLSYSVGVRLAHRASAVSIAVTLVLLWTWALLPGPDGSNVDPSQAATALFYVTVLVLPTWLVGRLVRRHGERTRAFGELAVRVAAEQDALTAGAVAAERSRIGAELQDIIAHSVSAMVIQAGSARLQLRSDPGRARDSIVNVEQTGRQALSDLRRLLGMLRKDDDPRALRPQPGLSQLPALLAWARRSGLACDRSIFGDPIDLTPGVDLVAYRVIETALQAAIQRQVGHTSVVIHYLAHDLELEVTGDAEFPDIDTTVADLGQRIALYRGELRTQTMADAFAVRARLPLEAGAPA